MECGRDFEVDGDWDLNLASNTLIPSMQDLKFCSVVRELSFHWNKKLKRFMLT